jgi:hypothetical protein
MWCPACRTEYVDGVTHCADCGAELVAELDPADQTSRRNRGYKPVRIDLSEWDESRRAALGWLLTGRDIGFEWQDSTLVVDRSNEPVANELVDFLEGAPDTDADDDVDVTSWEQSALARRRARLLRDAAAFIVAAAMLQAFLTQRLFAGFPQRLDGDVRVAQFIDSILVPFGLAALILACSAALELYALRVDAEASERSRAARSNR